MTERAAPPQSVPERAQVGMAVGALGSVAAAAALVAVRGEVPNADVALVLVVFVVLGAALGGRGAGVVSALVAALSFNFFHTEPYNTLRVASADDIETTALLVVVGLAVGEITVRARRVSTLRDDDWIQMRRLQRVAELASRGHEPDDLLLVVTAELIDMLRLQDCPYEPAPFRSVLPRLERSGHVTTIEHRYIDNGFELPRYGVELSVVGNGGIIGRFVLAPTPGTAVSRERRILALALADQLGAVLAKEPLHPPG
jgi:uncharacterized protein DUF4118